MHGRVGIDSLPQHIMMGKTAALVRFEIAGGSDSVKELVHEMGKKLAMHVVGRCAD